ncbi:YciI family protein [Synechococcus sp. CCY9201]|jgi:uncharacterized protein|nr:MULTISPECIES: YciI family protein [unclassified Synechococcus]MEA5472973.1 YciI family protein [Synechococcus sp. CCY9201]QPN58550.1 hypothetical protein H8F24_09940 [Synechococcus sp. CBW1002]QPN65289.1 hypothetical protein H8F26_09610 [Synechococcus sp. CBW1006]CAK6700313.1 hypothetical protein IFHNHDMJ_02818 [Synechococcus sp. CBW1107]
MGAVERATRQRWFVKLEEGIVDKARFDAAVPAHRGWLAELEAAGHRPSSGYWRDRQGLSGAGGMLLFMASDRDEAERLVSCDPLVRQGCVRWVVHEWCVVAGELAGPPQEWNSSTSPELS